MEEQSKYGTARNTPVEETAGIFSEAFVIEGGYRLEGEIVISGAKNASLPMMAAALLTADECILHNVPDIEDVRILAQVLRFLGASVERLDRNTYRIRADNIRNFQAPSELVRKMRASFLVMGPLLARFGRAASCPPGGDVIGQRPIDVHLIGFRALGAKITQENDIYTASADHLRGTRIFMDYPSHIGTENLLMAACLAKGRTLLINASQEPEVVDLALMLNKMGARIRGAGTSYIEIEGVDRLHGTTHTVIPDRIEAGTYAAAAVITQGEIVLRQVACNHMESLIWKINEMGASAVEDGDNLYVKGTRPLRAVNVQALPYPGFATDLQSTIGVVLTQAEGVSVVHERVYDRRLIYLRELRKMGARVKPRGQTAIIEGPMRLAGTTVRALDIRSGAALVLAGLAAEGITTVTDIYHLDRGYQDMDKKLCEVGARIQRKRLLCEQTGMSPER